MILVFALDDSRVVNNAYSHNQNTYGISYCYNKKLSNYPRAKQHEPVFVTAHGNDDEIGNMDDSLSLTPGALASKLHNLFLPGNYQGDIYLFTCNSAPKYHKAFRKALVQLQSGYKGKVYGCDKKVWYPIYVPGDNDWKIA